jgi:ribosome maturation factor RimP
MGVTNMQDLHTLIETSVTQLGYALVDLEISNRGKVLRVFIDKQNPVDIKDSVNIDDCVLVSNQLGNLLAVENEIEYDRLEVSSPGMDRVLRKEADFLRFIGERATVKLHVPMIEDVKSTKAGAKDEKVTKKNFLGFLRGLENGVLLLECDGVTYNIALTNIDKSRLSPAF